MHVHSAVRAHIHTCMNTHAHACTHNVGVFQTSVMLNMCVPSINKAGIAARTPCIAI